MAGNSPGPAVQRSPIPLRLWRAFNITPTSSITDVSARDDIIRQGDQLYDQGRLDEREALLRQAMTRFADDPEICLRAALAVRRSDDYLARSWARHAAELAPDDPATLFRAARILFDSGDFDPSMALAQEAFKFMAAQEEAGNPFPLAGDLIHLFGRLLIETGGDQTAAEDLLRTAYEVDPDEPDHARQLTLFLLDRGRTDDATSFVRAALRDRPDDPLLREIDEWLRHELGTATASSTTRRATLRFRAPGSARRRP
jgi:tetratricopeptide (TPR) repeat protein